MTALNEWLKERRAIHDAATEGPWAVDGPAQAGPDDSLVVYPKNDAGAIAYVQPAWDDADAIVDAHNVAVPVLLAAVEKVLELHHGERDEHGCWTCRFCSHIQQAKILYPCATVRTIEGATK